MRRLRAIFITPAAALMLTTLMVPSAIICVYSVLTRGAYGGVSLPATVAILTGHRPLYKL